MTEQLLSDTTKTSNQSKWLETLPQVNRPAQAELKPETLNQSKWLETLPQVQLQAQRESVGLLRGFQAAAEINWVGLPILKAMGLGAKHIPDPLFRMTDEMLEQFTLGITPDYHEEFAKATSLEHAKLIRQQLLRTTKSRSDLASLGWVGIPLSLAAAALDPVAIGATIFTEGAFAPYIYATKTTRVVRAIRRGLISGGVNTALESSLVLSDKSREWTDLIYAYAGGMMLGGGFEFLISGSSRVAFRRALKDLRDEVEVRQFSSYRLTEKGEAYYNRLTNVQRLEQLRLITRDLDLDENDLVDVIEMGLEYWPGIRQRVDFHLAQVEPDLAKSPMLNAAVLLTDRILNLSQHTATHSRGIFRFDMVGMVKQSPIDNMRRIMSQLAEDYMPNKPNADGSVTPHLPNSSEWAARRHNVFISEFERDAADLLKKWTVDHGDLPNSARVNRNTFFELVTKVQRGTMSTKNPHINAMADKLRDKYADMLQLMKENNLPGSDLLPESRFYVPRHLQSRKMEELVAEVGEDQIIDAVANSIISFESRTTIATKDFPVPSIPLTKDQAVKVATAWVRHQRLRFWQSDLYKGQVLADNDMLRRILDEELLSTQLATPDEIEGIVNAIKRDATGKISRVKRRVDLDEGWTQNLNKKPENGGGLYEFRLEELFVNDAHDLINSYSRQVHGAIAGDAVLRANARPGEVRAPSFEALIKRLQEEASNAGLTGKQHARFNKDIERINAVQKIVRGIPLSDDDSAGRIMRRLRAFNYIRIANQIGFAQIPELGMLLGEGGIRAAMMHMPALRKMWKLSLDGRLDDELLREIETIWAMGTERLRRQPISRLGDDLQIGRLDSGKFDDGLAAAQRLTNDVSFMAPINAYLQRTAAALALQRWVNIAFNKGRFPNKTRLAALGLTKQDAEKIVAQIRAPGIVKTTKGLLGRKVRRMNLDKWADQDSAAKLITAVDRWSRRTIQQNNPGNLSLWMTSDIARLLIQFRTFQIVSYGKQFLSGVAYRDMATLASVNYTFIIGGLTYMAQQHIRSIGKSDRDELLKERLTIKRIGAGAFQRAGWAAILPGPIDTLLGSIGAQPWFGHGRTTGLSSDALFGNPTFDLLNKSIGGIRGLIAPIREDYDFSQQDLRNLTSVLPFQNMLGIQQFLNVMGSGLPEKSR